MNQLLQMVGTFASIMSIPLAIYFYIKTIDNKNNKVKEELIRMFSNFIGMGGKISHFYISSVLSAKLKENNLREDTIKEDDIIEKLVLDILSNPLLSVDAKQAILLELENIYNEDKKVELIQVPDGKLAGGKVDEAAERRKQLDEALRKGEAVTINSQRQTTKSKRGKIRQPFEQILSIVSVIAAILSFMISFENITPIINYVDLTNPLVQILLGIIASAITTIFFYVFKSNHK